MPIHVRAEPGDYAPSVLCPGDPRRSRYIAETFFESGARCVNEERGMLGFTGTFEGRPISVQATGMGCPSAAIVFEELIQLGARRLIRVGTAGSLQPFIQLADTVIALAATPEDTTALVYTNGEQHAPTASWVLVDTAVRLARESAMTVHVGPIVSSAVFYDPDRGRLQRWRERGHYGVEMEAAVLYTIAALRGVEALTLLTMSDIHGSDESIRISDAQLKEGVDRMMALACRVATAEPSAVV
jgi:5'-methylthioadenosine phosphorylase/purine-nucleoside phosphorylase